jgi:hypothetical protein
MKHRWSLNAAVLGIFVTILLTTVSDIPPRFLVGLFCPSALILAGGINLLHVSFSQWMLFLLIPLGAVGNAFWYMLLAETFRLLILSLKSRSHN